MHALLDGILQNGQNILKLTLSSLSLHDAKLVDKIGLFVNKSQFLIALDLSWSRLTPKLLLILASNLVKSLDCGSPLRNLNISYNTLCQDDSKKDFEASEKFIEAIAKYIEEHSQLIHVNMSGMNLSRD